eukprot:342252-Chlamydomonas_euryale.AAC.1
MARLFTLAIVSTASGPSVRSRSLSVLRMSASAPSRSPRSYERFGAVRVAALACTGKKDFPPEGYWPRSASPRGCRPAAACAPTARRGRSPPPPPAGRAPPGGSPAAMPRQASRARRRPGTRAVRCAHAAAMAPPGPACPADCVGGVFVGGVEGAVGWCGGRGEGY